jgi:predicted MPP superfamily phosphohydrolase
MQSILAAAHWFLYSTWIAFHPGLSPQSIFLLRILLTLLAVSFIAAALLSFRFSNWMVSALYTAAAVWLGLLNFLFLAACLCRMTDIVLRLSHVSVNKPLLADLLFALGALAAVYGLINARVLRLRCITVTLRNLPESWRGRTGLLISDLHLGPINGMNFCAKIAKLAAALEPAIIFIAGDLFDGTKADPAPMIAPLKQLAPPLGIYYSTGNHDEFGNVAHYNAALEEACIHVLENRMVVIDEMQIAGVNYGDTTYPLRLRMLLDGLELDRDKASILLNHVPNRLPIVEKAGIGLQLSGHTHGGQFFPFTWLTRRAFGKFTYGLQKFGSLQVYTSSGAGTWGPPMRVGTAPEVVLLTFA